MVYPGFKYRSIKGLGLVYPGFSIAVSRVKFRFILGLGVTKVYKRWFQGSVSVSGAVYRCFQV